MFGKFNDSAWGEMWHKLVRRDAPYTSVQAAKTVDAGRLERTVYEVIASHPNGCTQDEVLAILSELPYSSVTARFSSLIRKGYIEATGETRQGRSGRQQRILKITGQ